MGEVDGNSEASTGGKSFEKTSEQGGCLQGNARRKTEQLGDGGGFFLVIMLG